MMIAGTPRAVSSLMVLAPARQMTRSAARMTVPMSWIYSRTSKDGVFARSTPAADSAGGTTGTRRRCWSPVRRCGGISSGCPSGTQKADWARASLGDRTRLRRETRLCLISLGRRERWKLEISTARNFQRHFPAVFQLRGHGPCHPAGGGGHGALRIPADPRAKGKIAGLSGHDIESEKGAFAQKS